MPYSVEYWPVEKLVCIRNVGRLPPEDYLASAREFFRLMHEHGTHLCLIDVTMLDNQASTTDLYSLPGFYESIGIPKNVRAAVLVSDQTPKVEDMTFFETVCRNHGYRVRLFTARDEALAWLTA